MTPLSHGPGRRKTVWGSKYESVRQKATWGFTRLLVGAVTLTSALALATDASAAGRRFPKMDERLEPRAVAGSSLRTSRVIVTFAPGTDVPASLQRYSRFGRLGGINGHVLDLPDSELQNIANSSQTVHVHPDADVRGMDFTTNVTSGSFFVNRSLGVTGAGITVAVLDSGIAKQHDDLPNLVGEVYFKDFVNGKSQRYDDFGHGTHVAGILAGQRRRLQRQKAGTAPAPSSSC